MTRTAHRFFLLSAVVALASCTKADVAAPVASTLPAPTLAAMDNPADTGSAQPGVTLSPSGALYLSWQERHADSSIALRYAVRTGDAWSAPRDVQTGRNILWSAGDVPMVHELPNGNLVAVWRGMHGEKGYDVVMAHSTDKGATWSAPVSPHRDNTVMEHGFVSWLTLGDTNMIVWVDGRANDTPDKAKRATRLTLASLDATGNPQPETFLDSLICDCCHTASVNVPGGAVVAYRNRTEANIRDINTMRISDGTWRQPTTVHSDGWHIEGCPVNGPAVSAQGAEVAVAWFTAPNDTAHVRVAFSTDTANTFGTAIEVNEGFPDGHVGIAMPKPGVAIVSWIERVGTTAELRLRRVNADGSHSAAVDVAQLGIGRRAGGQPKLLLEGDHAILAWTDATTNRVKTARVSIP